MWFENQIVPNYKDCLTNIDTDYSNYNRFLKNASIVISTEVLVTRYLGSLLNIWKMDDV